MTFLVTLSTLTAAASLPPWQTPTILDQQCLPCLPCQTRFSWITTQSQLPLLVFQPQRMSSTSSHVALRSTRPCHLNLFPQARPAPRLRLILAVSHLRLAMAFCPTRLIKARECPCRSQNCLTYKVSHCNPHPSDASTPRSPHHQPRQTRQLVSPTSSSKPYPQPSERQVSFESREDPSC